jgi:tyrosine decarboxylase/aspartate 1-decarboxylase
MVNTISTKYKSLIQELNKYHHQDYHFKDGHILGSMCTAPHPIALEAYTQFFDTNLGDPDLFPGTKKMEEHLIHFISKMLNAPSTSDGLIVSGGTEGNISAMWIAKLLSGYKQILIPEHAHFSFEKIALLMDMQLQKIPTTRRYIMDVSKLKKHINHNVAAIVAIAGSTDLGTIDSIPEISDLCKDEHIFLHIDAAFGGFVIPFLRKIKLDIPNFDFTLPGVSTISVDAHKMGFAAIPLGALIIRKKKWIDLISVESPCISTTHQAGILGTRSGGPVAAAYAVTKYLNYLGYQKLVENCMQNTKYMIQKIMQLNLHILLQPTMNVVAIQFTNPRYVAQKLAQKGWRVNVMDHLSSIRIVLMPQITKQIIDEFIPDLKQVCKEVGEI